MVVHLPPSSLVARRDASAARLPLQRGSSQSPRRTSHSPPPTARRVAPIIGNAMNPSLPSVPRPDRARPVGALSRESSRTTPPTRRVRTIHHILGDDMETPPDQQADEAAQHTRQSESTTNEPMENEAAPTDLKDQPQKPNEQERESKQLLHVAHQKLLALEKDLESKETLLQAQASIITKLQKEKESLQEQLNDALAELAAGVSEGELMPNSRSNSRPCSRQHSLLSTASSGLVPDNLPPLVAASAGNSDVESKDVTFSQNAHLWGVTVQQVVDLHEQSIQKLERYCETHGYVPLPEGGYATDKFDRRIQVCLKRGCKNDHCGFAHMPRRQVPLGVDPEQMVANMHVLVDREIKPRTKSCGRSFALMKNPQGLKINVFITHTWGGLFREFVGTLVNALKPQDVVWVCSFALNQNTDIAKLLGDEDISKSPFAVALKQAEKQVVVLDTKLEVPDRAWCTYEISRANLWGVPTLFWFYQLSGSLVAELGKKVEHLDFASAKASNDEDLRKIRKAIEDEGGFEELNVKLRHIMGDRLRFYEAMGKQDQESENTALGELSQQLTDLRDRVVRETSGNNLLEVDMIERLHKGLEGQRFLRLRIMALTRQLEDARGATRRAGLERADALERAKAAADQTKLLSQKEEEIVQLQSVNKKLTAENEELSGKQASWLRRSLVQIEEIQDLRDKLSKCRCAPGRLQRADSLRRPENL